MLFDENTGPFPAGYRMRFAGMLKTKNSLNIKDSGISVGFETLDRRMFKPEACYQYLADCGVKWARCQTGWSRCETVKGHYDFSWLDDIADNLLNAGIRPWFSISYGNHLYCPDAPHESAVGSVPIYYGPEVIDAWERYVRALVKHFTGRIDYWEIWNEPNGDWCWGNVKPNGAEYVKLARITAAVIRQINPQAHIIGGAICNLDIDFFEDALRAGLGECCEIISFHAYHLSPEWGFASTIEAMRGMIARYAPHLRLWQGETGCPSVPKDHHDEWMAIRRMNEEIQAKWVARRVLTDFRHEIELSSYFHTADLMENPYVMGNGIHTHPVMLGLLNGLTYTPKKAYWALRNLCTIFDNNTVKTSLYIRMGNDEMWNSTRPVDHSVYANLITDSYVRHGYPLYVYYNPADLQEENTVASVHDNAIWTEAEQTLRDPILIDPVSGKVFLLSGQTMSGRVMTLPALPLMDYPLIITDAKAIEQ